MAEVSEPRIEPVVSEQAKIEACKEELRERFRSSLYLTSKNLLGYSEINRYTHGDMIRTLESDSSRKLIVMPRGSFKSSIGVIAYPIWLLMRNPNKRIFIDSEVYTNSKNFLRSIKAHLADPKFQDLFGVWRSDTNWTEGEITIRRKTAPTKEASITCGGIGAVKVGQHYDVIIADDLNSSNNSQTKEGRDKVIQHYRMNISILEPTGTYVVIGTRYSIDDCPGFILTNEIGIKNPDELLLGTGER